MTKGRSVSVPCMRPLSCPCSSCKSLPTRIGPGPWSSPPCREEQQASGFVVLVLVLLDFARGGQLERQLSACQTKGSPCFIVKIKVSWISMYRDVSTLDLKNMYFGVHLQPLPNVILWLAHKMPVLVLEKCVPSLLTVERDDCPTVPGEDVGCKHDYENVSRPHANPGVILLVPEPVGVAWVTIRPGLDLMVKP